MTITQTIIMLIFFVIGYLAGNGRLIKLLGIGPTKQQNKKDKV